MAGELGDLPGGWPEPFRSKVLAGRDVSAVGEQPLGTEDAAALAAQSPPQIRRQTLNRLLFPGPSKQRDEFVKLYGDLSPLGTIEYLYGLTPGAEASVSVARGVQLYVGLEAISEADDHGYRTVMATLNGQLRPLIIRDESVKVDAHETEKANPENPGHIAAPFAGSATVKVLEGEQVQAGQAVAMIEAMKMAATITTPVSGTVTRVLLRETGHVEARDLMLEITP